MWLGSNPGKRELALIKSRGGQSNLYRLKYASCWEENGMDVRSKIFVCDKLEFESFYFLIFFFFDWKERKLREAKKTLMDEMLCTYGMENCAILSQKAASEECIMAAASQVPGPLAALYHCTMCVTLVLHSSRWAGWSHSGREKFLELLEPLLRPKMVPSFSPFHPHTGAQRTKQLSSQLPPNLILLAHPPLRSSCFSADV